MATLRTALRAIAANDSILLGMLGDGDNSILPKGGLKPKAVEPWIELQLFGENNLDDIVGTLGFRWRVYDVTDQAFSRIDHIIGRLRNLYKNTDNVLYDDPSGRTFKQRWAFTSADAFDDGFSQHVRWVEWQLWRAQP